MTLKKITENLTDKFSRNGLTWKSILPLTTWIKYMKAFSGPNIRLHAEKGFPWTLVHYAVDLKKIVISLDLNIHPKTASLTSSIEMFTGCERILWSSIPQLFLENDAIG